jgi:hypothetical protein
MKLRISINIAALIFLINSCQTAKESRIQDIENPFYTNTKPCTRWWWFATEIKKKDIKYQLDWVKENNFGGVEVCWLYPLYRYKERYARMYNRNYSKDTSAQKWLSPEWSEMVAYTKAYSDSIGLSCDFTFGSAWVIAGDNISKKHGTQIYGDTAFEHWLTYSWAYPDKLRVINHLDQDAFEIYAQRMAKALKPSLKGVKNSLFVDSWEIKMNGKNKIWTPGFDSTFKANFGYDIIPFMETGLDSFPDVRYDYMLLIDKYVSEGFYEPFVQKCKDLGTWSRVQCLASPTDVMTTYGLVDIPETEAMLNNPNYARIVSSSACLSSKPIVSSETFTCMYGFPGTYLRQEQMADLKMVADALFAQGINHHFYHGMPYNPKDADSIDFFATTYIGRGGNLTEELPAFNSYMEKVAGFMQKGKTYSDVAVYIPYEDGVMKGAYPPERQRVWVWGEYEMRFINMPKEVEGYHPIWINRHFLSQAEFINKKLVVGDAQFSSLYIDVNYMDIRALEKVLHFAKKGLPVCLKRSPAQPGKLKSEEYRKILNDLMEMSNVSTDFSKVVPNAPLLQSDSLPAYWCKKDKEGNAYLFLAQSKSKDLVYPVFSGQSFMKTSEKRTFNIAWNGISQELEVEFKPYQSVLLKITPSGKIEYMDIAFMPKTPTVKPAEPQLMNF